jgi:membrane-associated phospholipid phosphatase
MQHRIAAIATVLSALAGTVLLYVYFVQTAAGQRLDERLVPRHGLYASDRLLAAYDRHVMLAEPLILALVLGVAVWRGQKWRGLLCAAMPLAVVLAVNAAKVVLPRPDRSIGSTNNSFPSGHVALAAATVVAVVLVLPAIIRPVAVLLGALAVAVVAAATITAPWHRFSDAAAAVLLSVAAGGLVVLASPSRESAGQSAPGGHAPAEPEPATTAGIGEN